MYVANLKDLLAKELTIQKDPRKRLVFVRKRQSINRKTNN